MPHDAERQACLEAALNAAQTGLYENAAEVAEALSLSEAGIWNECLVEPQVVQRLDEICAKAFARKAEQLK